MKVFISSPIVPRNMWEFLVPWNLEVCFFFKRCNQLTLMLTRSSSGESVQDERGDKPTANLCFWTLLLGFEVEVCHGVAVKWSSGCFQIAQNTNLAMK